jgi:hypothetical protein
MAGNPTALADVHVSKSLQELTGSGLGRGEVAHDDIGDERGSDRVVGTGGGDERAREFEHRPKEVARELVVIDHQDVNPSSSAASSFIYCRRGPRPARWPSRR